MTHSRAARDQLAAAFKPFLLTQNKKPRARLVFVEFIHRSRRPRLNARPC